MDNFIFSILLKQQQNGLKTSQTEDAWPEAMQKLGEMLQQFN
jgi:hypothetical protein